MDAVVIIPARMAASRFPGKPLAKIAGLSMIGHCFLRASMAKQISQVYVATCDNEIRDEINRLNGQVIMTSVSHERASDRTAEALYKLEIEDKKPDVVVMVQGDEPLVHPDSINQLVQGHIQYPNIEVFNLTQFIHSDVDFHNPNVVKLLTNLQGEILAFSREPIPSPRMKKISGFKPKKQLGIISFRRNSLIDFLKLPPTPLEKIESIDMMRFLEYGRSIKEIMTDSSMIGVDTPEDAKKVEELMLTDTLYQKYRSIIFLNETIV